MKYVIELEKDVWKDDCLGDPGRTTRIENAAIYDSEEKANSAISAIRSMSGRKFKNAKVHIKFISKQNRAWVEKIFSEVSECVEEWPEYWIGGSDDQSLSFCFECAEKEVRRLSEKFPNDEFFLDGGWGIAGDSTPFCETCKKRLENEFTTTACEEEVEHFLEYGFDIDSGDDCLSMDKIISSAGWEPLPDDKDIDFYNSLHRLCRSILSELI